MWLWDSQWPAMLARPRWHPSFTLLSCRTDESSFLGCSAGIAVRGGGSSPVPASKRLFTAEGAEGAEGAEDCREKRKNELWGCSSASSAPSAVGPLDGSPASVHGPRTATGPEHQETKACPMRNPNSKGMMPPHRRQRRGPLGDSDAHGAIRSMVGAVQMPFALRRKFPIFRDEPFFVHPGIRDAAPPLPGLPFSLRSLVRHTSITPPAAWFEGNVAVSSRHTDCLG